MTPTLLKVAVLGGGNVYLGFQTLPTFQVFEFKGSTKGVVILDETLKVFDAVALLCFWLGSDPTLLKVAVSGSGSVHLGVGGSQCGLWRLCEW